MSSSQEKIDAKRTLREQAVLHRDRLDRNSENMEEAVDRFFREIKPQKGQIVAGYWPKGTEFDARYILDDLLKKDFLCALPVTEKSSKLMKFARWNDGDELEEGLFGIKQPKNKVWVEPDIVLVPFLAFDRKGYRLGYGGGYYDVTLEYLRKQKSIMAVGVGYAQQAVLFTLPVEEHDQRLDWIITPQDAHRFIE